MSTSTHSTEPLTQKRGEWVSEATSTPPTRLLLPPRRGRHHAHKFTPVAHRAAHLIESAVAR